MEITTSNSKGTLTISEEVLSSIATNAAKDVDGVSSFSNRPVDVVSTIKQGSLKVMSPVRILSVFISILSLTKKYKMWQLMFKTMFARQFKI